MMTRLTSLAEPSRSQSTLQLLLSMLLIGVFLLYSARASATHFELYRLAAELDLAASQLAAELRHIHGYSSVRTQAISLARDASRLVDAIDRGRSASRVRSKFNDLSRRYTRLEEAFLRSNRSRHNAYVFEELGRIHNLFSSLSSEYYYSSYRSQPSRPYYYSQQPMVSYPPAMTSRDRRYGTSYSQRSPSRNSSRSRDYRQPAQQNVLTVPRGADTAQPRTTGQGSRAGRERDHQRQARPANDFDHRSSVLDRQARNENRQRRVEAQGNVRHSAVKEVRRRSQRE